MTLPELKKILYVEDDLDIQVIAMIALEHVGGFTVRACSSGAEALAVAPEFQPDLILLDVMMPGMDGFATLAALRREDSTAAIPVIFMTAKVQGYEIADYHKAGALGVIAKPFDPMTLAAQIRTLWARATSTPDTR